MSKKYIKNPADAPTGAKIQQGPRGGYYYDDSNSMPTEQPVKKTEPVKKVATPDISEKDKKHMDIINKYLKGDMDESEMYDLYDGRGPDQLSQETIKYAIKMMHF